MQIEARESVALWQVVLAPLAAVLMALALCSLLIVWTGSSVGAAYLALWQGGVGSRFALTETLTRATPLILTGLAVAVAFRAKLWNIGAEGQFYAGALAATLLGSGAITAPAWLLIPLLLAAGAGAGGLLLGIPAWLKVRFRVDEVVTTLLLNFIVLLAVSYLLEGPLKDPLALGWPQARPIMATGVLPKLMERTRLHGGLLLALAAAGLIWGINRLTIWGYEMKAVGSNPEAAAFLGIPVHRVILYTSLLSGGLAGLAGVSEVTGLKGYLTLDLSPGFGYSGIVVAMLAQQHPLGVVAAAVFIAGIYVGADSMSRSLGVPTYLADVIVATALLGMLVSSWLTHYRIRWEKKRD
ncbi:MAG: ABC transporter permease [Cyanobacteriota bacterium]|nr:ABC transporter permease [Cyanobacteriota bacterium]